jgi:error-prone DNA polymerase
MLYTARSYYSLRYGTMPVEKLVEEAGRRNIGTLAITDINNSTACLDFAGLCLKNNIQPICGMEFRVNGHYLYTCLALNERGLGEINRHLTEHNLEQKPLSSSAPAFGNVIVLYAPGSVPVSRLRENEYIGIRPWEAGRLWPDEYRSSSGKLVAHCPVAFASAEDYEFHRHLRAIDRNTLLDKIDESHTANRMEYFLTPRELKKIYATNPSLLLNASALLARCSFSFDKSTPKNRRTFTGSHYDDRLLLEKLAFDGLKYRYGGDRKAEQRVRGELQVIDRLGFSSYFLITWDIIRYAMHRGFYHVGRGSGGNSVVAYCLRITDIDPIELDLYFERFINPLRTSPPDFDIDFAWTERDEVLDYIFKRYGREHTALLGTINTFRDSSIIRELGKVYGLPKSEIDRLVDDPGDKSLHDGLTGKIFDYGSRLIDFPNYRSIHAGGVLISQEPITCYTALDLPPKGFPTTQWDMYVAEEIGFEKLDILSQRGIAHIGECVDIVRENRRQKIDVHRIDEFKKDPEINRRLYNGEAIGCFYIESPAMRGLLKKLKCQDYLRLVAASSIIRPGVAKSGMMKEYIHRFHNPGSFGYLHPVFEEHLGETFGIMVYQEDVIKIAHHFAGIDLADADILRRAMSGKFRSRKEFERIQDTFFSNCHQKGYPAELTAEVWRQIASFSGYAFCKAHSASYAVESYQSLYLKTHFPHEFHVAVINNFGGFYRTWVYVNEARRHGAIIELPCVNRGKYATCIKGEVIYLGLVHVKGLESGLGKQAEAERERYGEFSSLADFMDRVPAGIEQVKILIRSGAFRFTGKSKKELLWDAHFLATKEKKIHAVRKMFVSEPEKTYRLPPMTDTTLEDAWDEMELLGFPVTLSRFDMLQTSYRGNARAAELHGKEGKKVRMVGDLVTTKYVRTVRKEIMQFGCFLDEKGEFFDTVNFPGTMKKYPFTGPGIYLVEGRVTVEFGFPSVEVHKMARLPARPDPRAR